MHQRENVQGRAMHQREDVCGCVCEREREREKERERERKREGARERASKRRSQAMSSGTNPWERDFTRTPAGRKTDMRLFKKGIQNNHGALCPAQSVIKWSQTRRLSIHNSFSPSPQEPPLCSVQ